jgi:hypothetical protein
VPKSKLSSDPDVIALVNKKVAQVQTDAAKNAMRNYKLLSRTVKEAIGTANLERKVAKSVTEHVLAAIAPLSPATSTTETAAAE